MPVCEMEKQELGIKRPENEIRVCFVCTGNTCRSPMAAAVANFLAKERGADEKKIVAVSAGLYANDGEPISARAVEALEQAGITPIAGKDYHTHTAHTLTAEEIERIDLFVGLGGGHCMELLMRYPQAATRITAMPNPIADPYGGDGMIYAACLAQITAGVKQLLFSADAPKGELHDG